MKKILLIDDEPLIVEALSTLLSGLGYDVTGATRPEAGEREALSADFDLILVDLRMPEKNGAEVTKTILKAKPSARVLVITAFPSDPLARLALEAGAVSLVKKPFELATILEFLR